MSFITSALEGPYAALIKIGLVVALAVGLFGSGYFIGKANEKTIVQTKIVKQVEVQIKAVPGETKYITVAAAHADANHEKAKANVEAHPANPVCDVPADTVGVLNANRATLPAGK